MKKLNDKQLKSIVLCLEEQGLIEETDRVRCQTSNRDGGKGGGAHYSVYVDKENDHTYNIASFNLVEMVGCCGIVVSTGSWIDNKYRRHGLGALLNRIRIELAKAAGYSVLLCTDILDNTPQRKILAKNGWVPICRFKNRRTGNPISIDCIPLTEEGVTRVIDNTNYVPHTWLNTLYWSVRKYFKRLLRLDY